MSLSSISGLAHAANIGSRNTFVPTRAINTLQAGAGSVGRGGDSYNCVSCGSQKVVPSFYCPTCSGGSSARTSAPFSNLHGNCPMCNKTATYSASTPAGAVYYHNPKGGIR